MPFSIHSIYRQIFKIWRKKRQELFIRLIQPKSDETLLDVGGCPETWTGRPQSVKHIDCLNIYPSKWNHTAFPNHRITTMVGDGCALTFKDQDYSIAYSNSVIEHVGDWEKQKLFAEEVRRVGFKVWVQTPAFECPLEPHFLAPFIHWLPIKIRKSCVRWLTPWGWITRPSQAEVEQIVDFTQLLSKKQMIELFPDCQIYTEKLLGIIPKSYVAWRNEEMPKNNQQP